MTHDETANIILKLHGAYFSQDKIFNSSELDARIDIWDIYFKDFPFYVVNQAVTEWIAANKVMPQISEILPRCKEIRAGLQSKTLPDNFKPTWEIIYDARVGEQPIKPEAVAMVDDFVKWLRADPKLKARYKQEQEKNNGVLPYEI